VPAVKEHDFDLRGIAEARDAITREARIEDLPILELDGLEEGAA